jgi:hypothetical protein
MDVVDEFKSRKFNNSKFNCVYFIIVVVFGGFFSFNLIVSVVVDNFNRIKEEQSGKFCNFELLV